MLCAGDVVCRGWPHPSQHESVLLSSGRPGTPHPPHPHSQHLRCAPAAGTPNTRASCRAARWHWRRLGRGAGWCTLTRKDSAERAACKQTCVRACRVGPTNSEGHQTPRATRLRRHGILVVQHLVLTCAGGREGGIEEGRQVGEEGRQGGKCGMRTYPGVPVPVRQGGKCGMRTYPGVPVPVCERLDSSRNSPRRWWPVLTSIACFPDSRRSRSQSESDLWSMYTR
eukprot:364870-Chlamydomonas_euryale.AAC.20